MIHKHLTGASARKKILIGINAIYDTIKLTLGPEGKNAILPRSWNRGPRNTNDGITIAENIQPKDELEAIAADFFREGSKKTNQTVGDGTTTTSVLGAHLINKVFAELPDENLPVAGNQQKGVRALRKQIKEAKDLVIEEINKRSKKVNSLKELEQIALISIGKEDEETAKKIAKLIWELSRDEQGYIDSRIDVVEGSKGEVETEIIKGMKFPAKVGHRAFVTKPERFEMAIEDAQILITNHKITNPFELVQIQNSLKSIKVALFAPDFSPAVITSMANSFKNGVLYYPVKCPALRTEELIDLAIYTGATVIDKDTGKKLINTKPEDLGFAEKIIVKDTEAREDATLLGGKGEKLRIGEFTAIGSRIETLKGQLKEATNDIAKLKLENRIANLYSSVGIIRVGASTDAELLYLKLKIEDGAFACKAALQEGYVKGGGLCLKEIAEELPENILTETLKEPYNQIQKNAGGIEIGEDIIDPAKVVRLEVEYGISIASQLITTDILIAEEREKNPTEGYEEIAKAISKYTYFWSRREGMLKGSEDEQSMDMEREFERAMANDHD